MNIRGFSTVQVNRTDGKGGVAIFIANGTSPDRIDLHNNFNPSIDFRAVLLEQPFY